MYKFGGDDTDTTSDTCLAMMWIVVCAGLVKKYNQVMQRYYVQYLSNYDALCLNSIIQVRHCLYRDAVTRKIKFSSIRDNNK